MRSGSRRRRMSRQFAGMKLLSKSIVVSTSTVTMSPGRTTSRPPFRARIFSAIVIPISSSSEKRAKLSRFRLLDLDAGALDEFRVFGRLGADERGKLGGAARPHLTAESADARAHVGCRQRFCDDGVQSFDDRWRSGGGREKTAPPARVESRHTRLGDRGNVRQQV